MAWIGRPLSFLSSTSLAARPRARHLPASGLDAIFGRGDDVVDLLEGSESKLVSPSLPFLQSISLSLSLSLSLWHDLWSIQ